MLLPPGETVIVRSPEEPHLFLCVAYPDIEQPAFDQIQAIRRSYDPNFAPIQPHFTIVFPVSGLNELELTNHIRFQISEVSQIDCELDTIETHESGLDGRQYLFLTPTKGAKHISALHDALYTGSLAPHLNHDEPYQPHITIGSTDKANTARKISAAATKQISLPVAARVRSITLSRFTEGHVTTLNEFELA